MFPSCPDCGHEMEGAENPNLGDFYCAECDVFYTREELEGRE